MLLSQVPQTSTYRYFIIYDEAAAAWALQTSCGIVRKSLEETSCKMKREKGAHKLAIAPFPSKFRLALPGFLLRPQSWREDPGMDTTGT